MTDDADQLLAQLLDLLLFCQRPLQGSARHPLLLELPPVAEIAGHLGKGHQLPIAVAHPADDHVGPEACAVLAHAPALVFEAALAGGGFQLHLALARVLRRIEVGEVLPDDLVGAVPLDALRAHVPGAHPTVRIEHENGIVLDALDQQAEAFSILRVFFLHRVDGARAIPQRPAQHPFQLLALFQLRLQRAHRPRRAAVRRDDVRVTAADLVEKLAVAGHVEVSHRVGAQQREALQPRQLVPQLLEADGSQAVPSAPEQVHHLAEHAHPRAGTRRAAGFQDRPENRAEPAPVGLVAHHEAHQRLASVEHLELAGGDGRIQVGAVAAQPLGEGGLMRLGGDDQHRLLRCEAGRSEMRHGVEQEFVVLVEMDDVVAGGRFIEEPLAPGPGLGQHRLAALLSGWNQAQGRRFVAHGILRRSSCGAGCIARDFRRRRQCIEAQLRRRCDKSVILRRRGHATASTDSLTADKRTVRSPAPREGLGGRCRIRTCDPCRVKAVLYR